ncbi:hypothetical protein LOTGIDRAFT_207719 [Lottia gigantea]|uniref:non-specific serine/threonine protein kinase n=1 Tax=Lottia gigantea TaxID=225164 RepID=V4AAS8_LOTGI|nr:hypothetical protein LOTGIDRAFT_207719 [Lottia gigantea]ESP01109.1 hypothetical protein LOTGIDRAFT_207719 [Lottia gigantea]
MKDVFIDSVPKLEDSTAKYPAALPKRLHDDGLGRNMTMFLVMKSCLTQLLEGIEHLSFHSIAHRDIKSNNILIDTDTSDGKPRLVISDFGCCLADNENGLKIPYVSSDQTKGGNPSLMAPEIVNAVPSVYGRSILDYSKSDLWAAGSLAYEIFGEENPFYGKNHGRSLNSGTYSISDLPPLPDSVPGIVQDLVYNMLEIDPRKRLTASTAATVLQIYLWNNEYFQFNKETKKSDYKLFILMLTLEVISKKLYNTGENLETDLKLSLLKRMTEKDLNNCVNFYVKNIK